MAKTSHHVIDVLRSGIHGFVWRATQPYYSVTCLSNAYGSSHPRYLEGAMLPRQAPPHLHGACFASKHVSVSYLRCCRCRAGDTKRMRQRSVYFYHTSHPGREDCRRSHSHTRRRRPCRMAHCFRSLLGPLCNLWPGELFWKLPSLLCQTPAVRLHIVGCVLDWIRSTLGVLLFGEDTLSPRNHSDTDIE
jgi:hypothetical protein